MSIRDQVHQRSQGSDAYIARCIAVSTSRRSKREHPRFLIWKILVSTDLQVHHRDPPQSIIVILPSSRAQRNAATCCNRTTGSLIAQRGRRLRHRSWEKRSENDMENLVADAGKATNGMFHRVMLRSIRHDADRRWLTENKVAQECSGLRFALLPPVLLGKAPASDTQARFSV